MKKSLIRDCWLGGGCLILSLLGCAFYYSSGVFGPALFELFLGLPPGLLVTLTASLFTGLFFIWQLVQFVLMPRLLAILARLGLSALVILFTWLPWHTGNDLFQLGRAHHIKSIFTEDLIAEVRQMAQSRLQTAGAVDEVKLTDADFPTSVAKSGWGFPDYARAYVNKYGQVCVSLSWGGGLLSPHGLLLTQEIIPEMGFPQFYTDNEGQTHKITSQTYHPWKPHGYIVYGMK
jgi:hypothetical protein